MAAHKTSDNSVQSRTLDGIELATHESHICAVLPRSMRKQDRSARPSDVQVAFGADGAGVMEGIARIGGIEGAMVRFDPVGADDDDALGSCDGTMAGDGPKEGMFEGTSLGMSLGTSLGPAEAGVGGSSEGDSLLGVGDV